MVGYVILGNFITMLLMSVPVAIALVVRSKQKKKQINELIQRAKKGE